MKPVDLMNPEYPVDRVDIRSLIIFPQPREIFDEIESLKEGIEENQLFSVPIVALLGREAFGEYIVTINELWGTAFKVGDFSPLKDGKYHVLIADERRTRAWRALAEEGKASWSYIAHIRKDIAVIAALNIQFAENTHRRVSPDRKAYSYNEFFRVLKKRHPEITLAKFARALGRSSEAVRSALRFCELPESVRTMVEKKHLRYSIAVELWRLQQNKVSEEEIKRWMFRAVIEKRTGEEFRKMISDYLFVRGQGQTSLLEAMSSEQEELLHKRHRRKVVEGNLVPIHSEQRRYFEKVESLISEGLLGNDDSPYSSGSPARRLKSLVETIRKLLPHLDALASSKRRPEMEEILNRAQGALAVIEKRKSSP